MGKLREEKEKYIKEKIKEKQKEKFTGELILEFKNGELKILKEVTKEKLR